MDSIKFTMRKKSGTIRNSSHGVKTKLEQGRVLLYDCPDIGVKMLLDDIHQVIISMSDIYPAYPYTYKIEPYE